MKINLTEISIHAKNKAKVASQLSLNNQGNVQMIPYKYRFYCTFSFQIVKTL